jgi:hypothetical protein
MSDPYIHFGRTLLPAALRRRRSLDRATRRLAEELDKHAGRLRHALGERLDTTRARFTAATTTALDDAIDGINDAITAAERAHSIDTGAADAARTRADIAVRLGSVP